MRGAMVNFPLYVLKCLNKSNGRKIYSWPCFYFVAKVVYFRFIDIKQTKQ